MLLSMMGGDMVAELLVTLTRQLYVILTLQYKEKYKGSSAHPDVPHLCMITIPALRVLVVEGSWVTVAMISLPVGLDSVVEVVVRLVVVLGMVGVVVS